MAWVYVGYMNDATAEAQINALSRAVTSTDASRRVGWASAYEAKAKLDETERDLNMARSDANVYRRGTSLLYGFLEQYASASTAGEARATIEVMVKDWHVVLDDAVVKVGRRAGQELLHKHPPHLTAEQREVKKMSHRGWDLARDTERKSLARQFGFVGPNAMIMHLRKHAGLPEYPKVEQDAPDA